MKCFFSIKDGYSKRIVGIVDLDSGILKQMNLSEYNISMTLSDKEPQLREVLLERKQLND